MDPKKVKVDGPTDRYLVRMRLLHRVPNDERGFTLVEAMVSLVIIFGLMVVLLRTFDSGTRVIVETRRQAVASAFASELIERGQALEWQHMGLATSTRGNSCATEQVGCYIGNPFTAGDLVYDALADEYLFGGEKVVFSNADTFRPFLNFYEQVQRDKSLFDRYLFVTSIENPVTGDEVARRLTAIVQWVPPGGFRKEVRLETIVAEYQEPSQPFVSGTVNMAGGALRLGPSGSGAYPGAYAHGTDWDLWTTTGTRPPIDYVGDEFFWSTINERQQFDASVNFPIATVSATSDFVSGSSIRITGTDSSRLQWEGADGLFGTPDDTIFTLPAAKTEFISDDDASTLPPLQFGATGVLFNQPLARLNHVGAVGQDIEITETTDYAVNGYLFTEVDPVPAAPPPDDKFPFAQLAATTKFPAKIAVGFTEYTEPWVRTNLYGGFSPLGAASYKFDMFRRDNPTSATSAIVFGGTVDRDDTPIEGYQQITASLDNYDGGDLHFLDDTAYPDIGGTGDFNGWVVITMPDIRVNVLAGQGVVALPNSIMSTMIIKQWDPVGRKYVVVNPNGTNTAIDYRANYGSDCDTGTNIENTLQLWGGAPITTTISTSGRPYLEYRVSGSVTVRGWCSASTVDGAGARSRTWFETKLPMITVDLDYQVVDYGLQAAGAGAPKPLAVPAGATSDYGQDGGRIVLYDLGLHYESEKLRVNAVYIDPSAD